MRMLYKDKSVYIFNVIEIMQDRTIFDLQEDCVFFIAVNNINGSKITNYIYDILKTKCSYIMTYGKAAEELHDIIDDIIVQQSLANPDNQLGIVTDYRNDEELSDSLDFFINYTYFKEDKHSYVIIADEDHLASIYEKLV